MTAAIELLAALRARGVTLEPRGDRLRVMPASAVTPGEVEALRRLKADVLALLTAPTSSRSGWYSYPWPDVLPVLGRRTVGPFALCAECDRWSWARYGEVVLCLACARKLLTVMEGPRS